ncbi:MAG: DUF523 and DUF1722 domain-containing protein [Candidatus Omnitrophota bacterium]
MKNEPRPIVFASKCLGFDGCRWNGEVIPDRFVDKLKGHADLITNCPEVEMGLGVPRDPIRIVAKGSGYSLMQLNTGRDVTDEMQNFAGKLVSSIEDVDGFILKDRSPSCGLKEVKVYRSLDPGSPIGKTSGFFAAEVLKKFGHLAIETEARLTNFNLRENFLTRIFISAKFRKLKKKPSMKGLVQFHTENKFLFMAYSQKGLSEMGRIVANHDKEAILGVFEKYEMCMNKSLMAPPKYRAAINVMMHALGYFSGKLSSSEKTFFMNTLEEYRREQVPLSVPLSLIRSYIARFEEKYLEQQTFFEPYPHEMLTVRDSGKGGRT